MCSSTVENAASVDEDEAEEAAEELESHLTQCSSLAQDKKAVVKALEDGQKMPCPECGLSRQNPLLLRASGVPRCNALGPILSLEFRSRYPGLLDAKYPRASAVQPSRGTDDV